MRVAVIGAGVAGMTAAYELTKGGAEVEVFEADATVGGLTRTIELWGQKVDLGPHRYFSKDPRINRLWFEVVGNDHRMVDRLTRIFYQGRFFHYPLQPLDALRNMGLCEAARSTVSYAMEQLAPSHTTGGESFESWVVGRFGRHLFELFFKSYSEKLWGIPCQELDADFAAQRIKKFSLGEAMKTALGFGRNRHKTLVDQFAYPLEGSGVVCRRMADFVTRQGGRVHLDAPVARVLCDVRRMHLTTSQGRTPHENRRVRGIELADGRQMAFDHVISTMPLTLLARGLGDVPGEVDEALDGLGYRNTVLVYLNVQGTDLFDDQWLYVHSPDLLTGRITNFRNWVPQLCGDAPNSILALEYWCYDQDPLWTESDRQLIARAAREIRATGLVGDRPVLAGHVLRLCRSYPVYRRGYKELMAKVVPWLQSCKGLTPIGRYGAFKYNNQDHSILMGLLAAENLLHGAGHDLWTVNADYDSYQESAAVTEMRRAA